MRRTDREEQEGEGSEREPLLGYTAPTHGRGPELALSACAVSVTSAAGAIVVMSACYSTL